MPSRDRIELVALATDPDSSPAGMQGPAQAEIHDDWTFELRGINGPRRFRLAAPLPGWGLQAVLAQNPWIDGDRVCALGGSYGGFMANWIEGNWPDRFRCLVSHDGVFDQRRYRLPLLQRFDHRCGQRQLLDAEAGINKLSKRAFPP